MRPRIDKTPGNNSGNKGQRVMTSVRIPPGYTELSHLSWPLTHRTTLRLYRNKVGIGEEGIYGNVFWLVLMFRCRTNILKLRWRDGFSGGAVDCLLRGAEEETVEYFVMNISREAWSLWR